MGNYLPNVGVTSRRKRTLSQALLDDDSDDESEAQYSAKRRKLKSTSEYIYETLFVNGESSDVTICALAREWHLHKIYLCQAGYFRSMFKGSWKETSMNRVDLDIPDENVTAEALTIALGSLYRDDIQIDPSTVVNLLATASLFSLDELIQLCAETMLENIDLGTVCRYYTASQTYGVKGVPEMCVKYLQRTLMPNLTVQLLKEIVPDMMSKLIESADLFVMQVEMDVYSMLRKWLYMMLNPDDEGSSKDLLRVTDDFIKLQVANHNWMPSFLETPQGTPYKEVFSKLRIEHIITDNPSAKVLENDHILPHSWLLNCYRRQWLQLLKVDSGADVGPKNFDVEAFEKESMRCGRKLDTEGQYCWRWTGFNYGIDILISCVDHRILLKRNTDSSNCHGAVAPQMRKHIIYRLTVTASSDATDDESPYTTTTGIQHLSLRKDEEVCILTVDRKIRYPLYFGCNFLLYTPDPATPKGSAVENIAHQVNPQPLPAPPVENGISNAN